MKASEFKEAMGSERIVVGFQQFLSSGALTEMAGIAGFDWVLLCTEHGSMAIGSELENLIRISDGVGLTSIVRVTHKDYAIVSRCLDLGAYGVLLPRVRTRADVEQTLEWVKYPPVGKRGFCGTTRVYGYGAHSPSTEDVNNETIVMLLIEELEAFDRLDEILSVPGVDCAMLGSRDLSLQLGITQQLLQGDPQAVETIDGYRRQLIKACMRYKVAVGDNILDVTKIPNMIEEGLTVFLSRPDTRMIQESLTTLVRDTRQATTQLQAGTRK